MKTKYVINNIEKTKIEIDALISTNSLLKGQIYKITGVHPTLYDDGTSSGTTIYLQAIETNQLSKEGIGKFYNPKYDKEITNYGIWDKYNKFEGVTIISGTSQNFETITADNGATATLLIDASALYFYNTTGDWSTAVSFTGGSSSSEATINGTTFVRSYAIGDKVIWGGYSWTNLNGNIGSDIDCLTLEGTEWSKDTFDEVNYNIAYDIITYDYDNDWITSRHEIEPNNIVSVSKNDSDNLGWSNFCAISVFQFGNGIDNDYRGIGGNTVSNSYVENINFKGNEFYLNSFNTGSAFYDNIFLETTYFDESCFVDYSSFYENIIVGGSSGNSGVYSLNLYISRINDCRLSNSSTIINCMLTNNSYIDINTLSSYSSINNNTLNNASYIQGNTLSTNSYIVFNTLSNDSKINSNTISNNNYIQSNTLSDNSNIQSNTLSNNSNIQSNTLSNSNIQSNTLSNNSNIQYNTLSTSDIQSNTLSINGSIQNNTLNNSTFDFSASVTLSATTISNINANYANATDDISAATIIYGDYSKEMFRNSSGVTRLSYYDGSDILNITNVND